MTNWSSCKNILCIRLDNMGDVLMSIPAMRALKESFGSRITLLTSSLGHPVTPYLPEIDEVLIYDAPWIKTEQQHLPESFFTIAQTLKQYAFDGAVIFTVCSQNPLPAIMMAWLAGIPLRLAWCRENPYELLTDWAPDEEPYTFIRHQVVRDLDLVRRIGANTSDQRLSVTLPSNSCTNALHIMALAGVRPDRPWMILHPGVSEAKREFPRNRWIAAGKLIRNRLDHQLIFTGSASQRPLTDHISQQIGDRAFSMAGSLKLDEFIGLIKHAPLVISVNTSTIHFAAATGTPVLALYATTNPQHTPWQVRSEILYYDSPSALQSKNEVVRYMQRYFEDIRKDEITPSLILNRARKLLVKQPV